MFRSLNKSAIWLLCQCVNHCLWNSSKLPFTGAMLQATSPPAHPPAMGGWVRGRLVSRSVGGLKISQAIQVCRFIHLGNAHSKQFAVLISSSVSISRSVLWTGYGFTVYCVRYFFVSVWQPAAYGILFLNNHKTETDREPRFLLKNLPQIRKWKPSQH